MLTSEKVESNLLTHFKFKLTFFYQGANKQLTYFVLYC